MSRKTKRQLERELERLRDDSDPDVAVSSSVVTVTDDMVSGDRTLSGDAVDVPDGATVVHDSDAVTAWVRE